MRLLRVQLRIRLLMAVVALIALGLRLWVTLGRRAIEYRRCAIAHNRLSQSIGAQDSDPNTPRGHRLYVHMWHHNELARKYWRASARPWLIVSYDVPDPERDCQST